MRNLKIMVAILLAIAILMIYLLIPEVKKINFSQIGEWFKNINLHEETDINENLNLSEETEDLPEDVGDLNFFNLELGRDDADIQSKRTYTFYLPVDITYEIFGVDASSSYIDFKKDGEAVFRLNNFDYVRDENFIDEQYPDWEDYSFIGGHTNVLELLDDNYEDEMYIFADTLKIDNEPAF
ncbi:MAG: hypothetical protein NT116_00260 [Candidatus Parcubacteria bacterium]|nr:hypothetical protein [Candidatus Parcubacteria bacterium]